MHALDGDRCPNDWAALFMYQAPRFAALAPGVSGLNVVNNVVSFDTITLGEAPASCIKSTNKTGQTLR